MPADASALFTPSRMNSQCAHGVFALAADHSWRRSTLALGAVHFHTAAVHMHNETQKINSAIKLQNSHLGLRVFERLRKLTRRQQSIQLISNKTLHFSSLLI